MSLQIVTVGDLKPAPVLWHEDNGRKPWENGRYYLSASVLLPNIKLRIDSREIFYYLMLLLFVCTAGYVIVLVLFPFLSGKTSRGVFLVDSLGRQHIGLLPIAYN